MNIKPTKITYNILKDETTFEYIELRYGQKNIERYFVMKGRYLGKRTVFEVTEFLIKKLDLICKGDEE